MKCTNAPVFKNGARSVVEQQGYWKVPSESLYDVLLERFGDLLQEQGYTTLSRPFKDMQKILEFDRSPTLDEPTFML